MPKTGTNIRKRKDGRYEGRYADGYKSNGKIKYRSVYAKKYSDVKEKLQNAYIKSHLNEPMEKSDFTLLQTTYMWLKAKKPYIKQSSYSHYLSIIQKHICPFLEKNPIIHSGDWLIENFAAELIKTLKPKTVRDITSVLLQILNYASEQGVCKKPHKKIKFPKSAVNQAQILTLEEQNRLMCYLKKDCDFQKFGVIMCLFTGIRLGEICGLKWEDIDLINGIIKIRRTIQRIQNGNGGTRFLIDSPKTQCSVRDIPLPDFLTTYLKMQNNRNPSAYLLTGTTNFLQPRTYQNKFKSYLKSSGLSQAFHFHTLRHTFASRAVELGFDAKTLSEILGHSSVNITLNRYVHTSIELKRQNMKLFQKAI